MRKKHEELDPELRMYELHTREVRRQLIPPIVFFAVIIVIILASVIQHNKKLKAGEKDLTHNAYLLDYLASGIGNTINENIDEIDDSYGDYFYLGIDFFELDKPADFTLWDHDGTVIYEGTDLVEYFLWECPTDQVTQIELSAYVSEISDAYGEAVQDESGVYWWHAPEGETLAKNDDLEWLSCGLTENNTLIIQGGVE